MGDEKENTFGLKFQIAVAFIYIIISFGVIVLQANFNKALDKTNLFLNIVF